MVYSRAIGLGTGVRCPIESNGSSLWDQLAHNQRPMVFALIVTPDHHLELPAPEMLGPEAPLESSDVPAETAEPGPVLLKFPEREFAA